MVTCTRLEYPSQMGGQITTPSPFLPKGVPKSAVFSAPSLRPPAGWLVALLLLSGAVERNPSPGRRWQCALGSQYIKTKSQTSIRCNHTTTHWVHITCTNITLTQCTDLWKCALHRTHAAPAQPTHPTNTTNQSLTISTQTINAPTDYTPGTSPREQATSPPTVGTPHADNTTTQLTRYQSTHTQHPSNCTSNQCIHNRYTPNCLHKQCTYT